MADDDAFQRWAIPGETGQRGGRKFTCGACPHLGPQAGNALRSHHLTSEGHLRNVAQLEREGAMRARRERREEGGDGAATDDPGGWDGNAWVGDGQEASTEERSQVLEVQLKSSRSGFTTHTAVVDAQFNDSSPPPDLEALHLEALNDADVESVGSLAEGAYSGEEAGTDDRPSIRRGMAKLSQPRDPLFPFSSNSTKNSFALSLRPNRPLSAEDLGVIFEFSNANGGDVCPSVRVLKRLRDNILHEVGLFIPRKVKLSSGRSLFLLSPIEFVKADFATPSTRDQLSLYSDQTSSPIRSAQQAEKWRTPTDPRLEAPMVVERGMHYYVREIVAVRGREGEVLVFVDRWYKGDRGMCGEGRVVVCDDGSAPSVGIEARRVRFSVAALVATGEELVQERGWNHIQVFSPTSSPQRLPSINPDRTLAGGRAFYVVPVNIALDDFAGGVSKRWSQYHLAVAQNACLPPDLKSFRENSHFLAASSKASPHDLIEACVEALNDSISSPYEAFDSLSHQPVLVRSFLLYSGHDNPMGAELCCRPISARANCSCRRCRFGGSGKEKATAEMLVELTKPGDPVTADFTRSELLHQRNIITSLRPLKGISTSITKTGVTDRAWNAQLATLTEERKRLEGLDEEDFKGEAEKGGFGGSRSRAERKAATTAMLETLAAELERSMGRESALLDAIGFNLYKDTIGELLHLGPLGLIKYLWLATISPSSSKTVIRSILSSLSVRGLSDTRPNLPVWIDKPGTMVGKDFRLAAQIAPFIVSHLVDLNLASSSLLRCWTALSTLMALLYVEGIPEMEEYQTRARNSLDDVFRSFYAYNPKLVINRPKFHAFVHLLTDIRRFGPAKFISNEWSESFNRPVRDALQNTNRLFPSRDLASHFGDVERALFLFRGGIWRTAEGEERQAGRRILEDFEDGVLRKLMGYGKRDEALPATLTYSAQRAWFSDVETYKITLAHQSQPHLFDTFFPSPPLPLPQPAPTFRHASTVRLVIGGTARVDDYVLLAEKRVGRVVELLSVPALQGGSALVTVVLYRQLDSVNDGTALVIEETDELFTVLDDDIISVLHVLHDCRFFRCTIPRHSAPRPEGAPPPRADYHVHPHRRLLINLVAHRSYWPLDVLRSRRQGVPFSPEEAKETEQSLLARASMPRRATNRGRGRRPKKTLSASQLLATIEEGEEEEEEEGHAATSLRRQYPGAGSAEENSELELLNDHLSDSSASSTALSLAGSLSSRDGDSTETDGSDGEAAATMAALRAVSGTQSRSGRKRRPSRGILESAESSQQSEGGEGEEEGGRGRKRRRQ